MWKTRKSRRLPIVKMATSEKNQEELVDTKSNVKPQCAIAARKANSILGCISSSVTSRLEKVILPSTQHW